MNKQFCKLLMMIISTSNVAYASEKSPKKLLALDADFLLFIAEMEKVDDTWLDPIALDKLPLEQLIIPVSKTSKTIVASDKKLHKDDNPTNTQGVK